MKYLSSIKFNQDIVFESNREDHKKKFKVKSRTYTEENRRKPIYATENSRGRILGYEKRKVVERSFIIFPKNLEINFSDITIIVGDNGSGKSSMLKYLKLPDFSNTFSWDETKEQVIERKFKNYLSNENKILSFDQFPELFVFENAIHKNSFIDSIGKGKTFVPAEDIIARWNMKDDSNGETTIDFITSLIDIENSLIILDEPETSLSIKSQLRMSKILKKLSTKNQLIIVTHSPIFMNLSKTVYDFESKQYVKTNEYIDSQYN